MRRAIAQAGVPDSARLTAYSAVSTFLALHSDRLLSELVDSALPLGSGIGGTSALLKVDGKPVFVKRVPLTGRSGCRSTRGPRPTCSGFLPTASTASVAGPVSGRGGSSPCTP